MSEIAVLGMKKIEEMSKAGELDVYPDMYSVSKSHLGRQNHLRPLYQQSYSMNEHKI